MGTQGHKRRYGTITKLGERWRIRWREGERRCSAMFATREQAETALSRQMMKLARELRPVST
jgi:hypothetical protein